MRFSLSTSTFMAALIPTLALAESVKRGSYYGANDKTIKVLQFANTLEALEYTFYDEVLKHFTVDDITASGVSSSTATKIAGQLTTIRDDEKAHLDYLTSALTGAGFHTFSSTCQLDFSPVLNAGLATTLAVARVFELVGVGAYAGAAPLLDANTLITAAEVLTIEARHSTFLNALNGGEFIPAAFDIALSPAAVISLVAGSGVITGGCDFKKLGLTGYAPLTTTTKGGEAVAPGSALAFQIGGKAQVEGWCHIVLPGSATAIVTGAGECVIPSDAPAGPAFVYLSGSSTPISSNPNENAKASSQIFAGPSLHFISNGGSTSWFA